MEVSRNYKELIQVNCPEVYAREDFQEYLNDETKFVATWHRPGFPPEEYSDVFMCVDGLVDGSNSDMPKECWDILMKALADAGVDDRSEAVVWLTNLQE